ncbi:MAG: hypothetical protein CVV30_03730 [Methanomicrobiales archaeon HGW-Methanomicrobiales-1]|nr:MAG: hypothetical protein CVV30_03730 [Methanomicrobiales archaeon HGW-Methanomicrobiales-1]
MFQVPFHDAGAAVVTAGAVVVVADCVAGVVAGELVQPAARSIAQMMPAKIRTSNFLIMMISIFYHFFVINPAGMIRDGSW